MCGSAFLDDKAVVIVMQLMNKCYIIDKIMN
jgi:hypothetical protein